MLKCDVFPYYGYDWRGLFREPRCTMLSPEDFAMFRWVLFCVWFMIVFYACVVEVVDSSMLEAFSFLTFWANTLEVVYLGLASASTSYAVRIGAPLAGPDDPPWFVHCAVLSGIMSLPLNFVVSLMYWGWVAAGLIEFDGHVSILLHVVNSLFVIMDLVVAHQVLPLRLVAISTGPGIAYMAFSYPFYKATGIVRYEVFRWEDGEYGFLAGVAGGAACFTMFIYVVMSCCTRPRQLLEETECDPDKMDMAAAGEKEAGLEAVSNKLLEMPGLA